MTKSRKGKATVMLLPHDGASVTTVSFPSFLLKLIPTLIIALISVVAWMGWEYKEARKSFALYQQILSENRTLKQEVSRIEEMEKQLTELERFGTRIRTFAGLGPASQESEDGGHQGGPLSSGLMWDGLGKPDLLWRAVAAGGPINIQQRLLVQRVSFEEILTYVAEQKHQMSKMPSIWPISESDFPDRWISSGFGRRRSPFSETWEFHSGVDIVAPRNAPIRATADGVVIFVGQTPGMGRQVTIDHDGLYETTYGHCSTLSVKEGQHVSRGESVATVGTTGRTTGVHVHYEVKIHGRTTNPVEYMLD